MPPPVTITKPTIADGKKTDLIERLPKYLFPLFYWIIQELLKWFASVNAFQFIGPTLVAAGASLVASMTSFRSSRVLVDLPDQAQKLISQSNFTVEPKSAGWFRTWCFIISGVMVLIWTFTVLITIKPEFKIPLTSGVELTSQNAQFYIGIISYGTGIALSELKEKL